MRHKLPTNCVIETLDYDRKDRAFRLVFQSEEGNDYCSEVYYPAKGQRLKTAAYEICARYGWLELPPAAGVLTRAELLKLETLVEDAIYDMDRRPERYVPDPDKFWREMLDWDDDRGEFYMDGSDLLACGDPPIPSQDCDRDDGWTAYNYSHDMYRVIPASVVKRRTAKTSKGPRGIEVISFSSGDMDGNWETEAQFVRHQKGVKITADEDRQRATLTGKANEDARAAYNAASIEDSTYGDLYRAWVKASDAHKLAQTLRCENIDEECWDPEEFRYYAAQMNCYWTLLRYKRYEIWCALHGEDPLGNVNPESEDVDAVFEVTARQRGNGELKLTAIHVSGNLELEKEAIDYVAGHTLEEIKEIIRENPNGRPIGEDRWGSLRKGWTPGRVTVASATFIVTMKGRVTLPLTPLRIRQVSCKGLEEDVKRMMHQIEKHYPEKL
jgi:hypothetical protein